MTSLGCVLIIDDEPHIRRALKNALNEFASQIVEAETAAGGIDAAAISRPDLVILDIGLPDQSGAEVCRELRRWATMPIIVLSARHNEQDKVELFSLGADDYVTKPFGRAEFIARVQAHMRRARAARAVPSDEPVVAGALTIDLARRTLQRDGEPVRLTPIEWNILRALVMAMGRTLTHQQLFEAAWDRSFGSPQQYLRVYITNLRRKIEERPAAPKFIVTEPGVGYRFESMQ
jgi:two-component system KDP operon response regulator KdpE